MTAIPSQTLPTWSTDSTVSSGDESGQTTRYNMGAAALAQGAVAGRRLPARFLNWVLGGFGDWLAYLREANGTRLSTTARTLMVPLTSVCENTTGAPGSNWCVIKDPTKDPSGAPVVQQTTSALWFLWDLGWCPRDALITMVSVGVKASPLWNALPATKPAIALLYEDSSGELVVAGDGGTADDPADLSAWLDLRTLYHAFATPVDLNTAGTAGPVRLFLSVSGAADSVFSPVYFKQPMVTVKSKTWT